MTLFKNLYQGDTRKQAGRRVGISRSTTRRWARAWNDDGVDGLRPRFGGGRPPKLTPTQFEELCGVLEAGQPWAPQAIHAIIARCTVSKLAHIYHKPVTNA